MNFSFYRPFCYLLLTSSLLSARTFEDTKGRKIEASVTALEGDKVTLKLDKTGKSYEIALETLSAADQKFVTEWSESNKSGKDDAKPELSDPTKPEPNFDAEWPDLVKSELDIEIETVEDGENEGRFVYHSPNYEFISDVGLSKSVVKKFAVLFEATREYCRLLPIATMKAHVPGAQFRNRILLFEDKADYVANGGSPNSAGVFISRGKNGRGVVMVPIESLGLKKLGSSYTYDYKGKNNVVIHEIAHQLTDSEYYRPGARGWFTEGLAEYVANTPYRSGKYKVRTNLSAIKDYGTGTGPKGRGGRNLGEEITSPDLKDFMLMPYSQFTSSNVQFNYGFSMLITYYFFHMEEDRTNINNFLKALKEGKTGEDILNVLLNGRSWDEMEAQISKAWRSKGVKITFK